MIAHLIYGLCMVLSLAIALMLWRHQRRRPTRLIVWTAVCFSGLALSNLALILDKLIFPEFDLTLVRHTISLVSIGALLFGLIYEEE